MIFIVLLIFLVLIGGRTLASWILDYEWWKEIGQVSTWVSMMLYGVAPGVAVWFLGFSVYWIAHARGMKSGGARLSDHPVYARVSTLVILLAAVIFASSVVDSWTIVRYFGGRGLSADSNAWHDPVFAHPLSFYLFELPFYRDLLRMLLALSLTAAILHWATSRGWYMAERLPRAEQITSINIGSEDITAAFESRFFRILISIFLLALAVWFYLGRYELLLEDHGFMVGMDWVSETIRLPLVWLSLIACIVAAVLVWFGRRLDHPARAHSACRRGCTRTDQHPVRRPNEISLQKPLHPAPYRSHARRLRPRRSVPWRWSSLRSADAQDRYRHEIESLLDNVRLWDWRAFHDTVTPDPGAAPITRFHDTRRRPLHDRRPVPAGAALAARTRHQPACPTRAPAGSTRTSSIRTATAWCWPKSKQDHARRPARCCSSRTRRRRSRRKSLKLTRPEIYYGEVTHEPVFVNTAQQEFNYPSGAENVHTRSTRARAAFRCRRFRMRLAAAIHEGESNILLTELPDAEQPHDDPPQDAGAPAGHSPASSNGTPIRTW